MIHLAFIHDFSNYTESCATDERAIQALGTALAGTGRPLIVTSGTLTLSDPNATRPGLESDPAIERPGLPRKSEAAVFALSGQGIRTAVVRLPPSVHGKGDHGFISILIASARATGESPYVGDGANVWPSVHVLDAARVFVAAFEKGTAGSVYHAVGDEGVPMRQIAEVIAKHTGVPAVSVAPDSVAKYGFMGHVIGANNPTSSAETQEELGVKPTEIGLIADIELHYFGV